jgi:phosphoribosylformylglycinamidine synthase subunit PurSL
MPYVCMTVGGRIPDVSKTVSADIKSPNSTLYVVGEMKPEMGGSVYTDIRNVDGLGVAQVDMDQAREVFFSYYDAVQTGKIKAGKSVGKGGVIAIASQMAFGGDCGLAIELDIPSHIGRTDSFLFNQTPGTFVVEVTDDQDAKELFGNVPYIKLGKTTAEKRVIVSDGDKKIIDIGLDVLKSAWKEPLRTFA